ncbi:hypothetical protein Sango_0272100 [Sesamum angolense]|uniref:Transmembrane protein n=1 Tax=Sesamum angolense TaxID=2727404 RepID=A0AAE2C2Q7_9LAMI|nr:hypothetical protein Sango_0272100 [Sesamum angolense]
MEFSNSKAKDVVVDIESGEASHGANVKRDPISSKAKKSLNRLVGGILGYNKSAESEANIKADAISAGGLLDDPHETTALLADNNPGQQPCQGPLPLAEKDHEKERRKAGKVKKAPKPPRPPKGPSLDAADMRLIKEISKIAMKKRERIERLKAYRKMKAARLPPPSSSSSSSSAFSPSSGGTISAMVITILFILVLIFQGLGSLGSSNLALTEAPQPAPETTDLSPIQLYKTLSDDGAAPIFLPPKSVLLSPPIFHYFLLVNLFNFVDADLTSSSLVLEFCLPGNN